MAASSLDALVITSTINVRYLTNHQGTSGVLIVTPDGLHLLIDFRYRESMQVLQASDAACPGLQVRDVPASYDEALLGCLVDLGSVAVGFEAAHVSVAKYHWLRDAALARTLAIDWRPTERAVERLRLIKDAFEVERIREAARRLDGAAEAAFAAARPGVSERAVAASIEAALRAAGFERQAFDTIVASGPHSALPHYRAGDRILATGDLLVLDFGGVLDGYCCDLTRTVSIGPPSAEIRRLYEAVHAAQTAAIASVRPGIDASEVDAAARSVLEARGLGEAFGHGTGHGIGLEVHEEPRIGKRRADLMPVQLAPGMVFTVEPGAYLPGLGGVRIEDDVLVTEGGGEVLTLIPREFRVC
jgi:Xaa-Pro aminopeptidase